MHPNDVTQRLNDFADRGERHRRWAGASRPKALGDVLAQLIAKRGYAASRANEQLAEAWAAAAGPRLAPFTEACRVNRGRLEVTVASSAMMQELTFDKRRILAEVGDALPDAKISDWKLRVGKIDRQQ